MRPVKNAFALLALAALAALPATQATPAAAAEDDKPPVPKNLAGFSPAYLDRGADPCQDFDQFACGTWKKNSPVPSDQGSWSPFDQLYLNNLAILYNILGKVSADDPKRSPVERRIGDYYAACMDEKAIEARGTQPIQDDLTRIAQLKDKAALPALIARLHSRGVEVAFGFGSTADFKDSSRTIAQAEQGGIGLPSRDYYTAEDARAKEIRAKYVAHLQKMYELLGDPANKAAAQAQAVLRLETVLAKGALTPVEARDPDRVYNLLKLADLQALTPSFRWQEYLKEVGAPAFQELNVATPDFFRQLEAQLKGASLDDWKSYLRARLVDATAPMLPAAFVQENFAFNATTLSGVAEISPRWKRCIQHTDDHLGEDLGQKYVEVAFGEKSRERMDQLLKALYRALEQDIKALDWMSAETKKQALDKLTKMGNKVGYPKQWRDYGALQVARGDALGNWSRGEGFEMRHQLAKIGKPTDDDEWLITPATVNAYYNPPANDINFPAGILQPPFFDVRLDDAVNFGAIGGVIGHELTHGFDDQGRQFDAEGDLRDWWTPQDGKEFEKRASCIADQYSGYTAVGDVKVNGQLTLGENVADLGGLRIAHMALQSELKGKKVEKIDGFTPEQRFFLGWAQIWCENSTPEAARRLALTNPHAPGRYRTNGVMVNMPEFREAFQCKAGDAMVNQTMCKVW